MKHSRKISLLLFLFCFGASVASTQTIPVGTFQHIVIVVQENRTPDNLFGAGSAPGPCKSTKRFEPGIDIQSGGYGFVYANTGTVQREFICNASLPLNAWDQNVTKPQIIDPNHSYNGMHADYDKGNMDGFCHEFDNSSFVGVCPPYSFVQKSDEQPYFDIATNYGFADYMFQTNQGASFSAHQFLFTGTSAPVEPHDPNNYFLDFASENVGFNDSGCPYLVPRGHNGSFPMAL